MGFQIEDGTGAGTAAKVGVVGGGNRLFTFALIESTIESFTHEGKAFSIATDFIPLTTTASFTGVLYISNTSATEVLHIHSLRSSSTVNCLWKLIKNPTTGTLISAGTSIIPSNISFSSGKYLPATVKKGTDAQTITNGEVFGQFMTTPYSPFINSLEGSVALNVSNSMAVVAQPTSAGSVGCTILMWHEGNEEMIS